MSIRNDTLVASQEDSVAVDQKRVKLLKNKESVTYDPYNSASLYSGDSSMTWAKRALGRLKENSLRTGSMGLVAAILGTGILAVPYGIAQVGWVTGSIIITLSALGQLLTFYYFGYCQAKVKLI